jgi:hypothetical protein
MIDCSSCVVYEHVSPSTLLRVRVQVVNAVVFRMYDGLATVLYTLLHLSTTAI